MLRVLVINAHPKVAIEKSKSLQVARHFKEKLHELEPTAAIETLELYGNDIPVVDGVVLSAWGKLAAGEGLSETERTITHRMGELLEKFKWANRYVFVMPLYNFNIPSKLKDYLDNVLIARETFAYGENGPIGLLNDGRKVLVIQASDGIYSQGGWYADVEFSHKYLKMISTFVGIDDYTIIRAEGGARLEKEAILSKAKQEAEEAARHFAAHSVVTT
ncbi:NAD(P)H-dependent oxidoreductase [Paenibacillus oryzisoli]|uniref:FMN-dependent NADH-azoreductase n=1 Tax=Paenibacillus oryzisoli TaxID=1850517 RepID=UPI003D2AE5E6